MITRIHGATSTLAANPRRKHHKRRNPKHHARRRNPDDVVEKKKRTIRSAAEQLAALQEKIKKVEDRAKRAEEAAAKRAARPGRKQAGAKTLAARARKARRQALGISYNLREPPAGAHDVKYGYAYYNGLTPKGKRKLAGYAFSSKLSAKKKPRYTLFKTERGAMHLMKNPGGLVIAGVPVIQMALGSAATIAIGAVSEKLIAKFAPAVATSPVGDIAGELATATVAWALHDKVLKNPMHKSIAQFAFIGAVFQILSKKASPAIKGAVEKIPGLGGYSSAMSGVYFDPYTAAPAATNGYISADSGHVAGIYTDVNAMSGMGLFNAPSIYG